MKKYFTLFFCLIFTAVLFAQPANDLCNGATEIALNQTLTFNNTTCSTDSTLIFSDGYGDYIYYDIWYVFNCVKDTSFKVSSCESDFDTKIAVYNTNDCSNINDGSEIAFNDDDVECSFNELNSTLKFNGFAGQTYFIRIGGYNDLDYGNGSITVNYTDAIINTTNDSCHQAIILPVVNTLENCNPLTLNFKGAHQTKGATYCGEEFFVDVWFTFNSGLNTSIIPIMIDEFYGETLSEIGYFMDFYTDCASLNETLSEQCENDMITGFIENTDYWIRLSCPKDWENYDFSLCLVGANTNTIEEQNVAHTFNLHPNPAKDMVNLQFNTNKDYLIRLHDFTGKELLSKHVSGDKTSLDLTKFSRGVYMIQATSNEKTVSRRIIIE